MTTRAMRRVELSLIPRFRQLDTLGLTKGERLTWYADLVLVPIEAFASIASPPPNAFRIRPVTF